MIIPVMTAMLISKEHYKEPLYNILIKTNNIEIREYDEYIIVKTSINKNFNITEINMFRNLLSYISGANHQNKTIPMSAPVTTITNENSFEMLFYMLDAENISDLPSTDIENITFEKFKLGKSAVIKFSWFTNKKKIFRYKKKLDKYIIENNLEVISDYMVNRYDPPWRLPFLRRNEILVRIR